MYRHEQVKRHRQTISAPAGKGGFCFLFYIILLVTLLLPPANEVWGKVIFLHLSVILFTGGSTWAGTPQQVPPWAGTPAW